MSRITIPNDGGTLTVTYDGLDFYSDGYCYEERRRYAYVIDAGQYGWEYVGNDLYSGVGAEVDEWKALDTLLDYLQAAAERYRTTMGTGPHPDGDPDPFPPHVMEWAYLVDGELSSAQADLHDAAHLGELR